MSTQTWEEIIADRSLRNLPYKIKTNRYNKIIMHPASSWHGNYEYEIGVLLGRLLEGGKVIMKRLCAPAKEYGSQMWAG